MVPDVRTRGPTQYAASECRLHLRKIEDFIYFYKAHAMRLYLSTELRKKLAGHVVLGIDG
jgi:hypothetical protein